MTTVLSKPGRGAARPPSRPLPDGFRVDRRRFLKGGLTAVGAYAVAVSGATWLVGPNKAWAVTFDAFEPELARTLLAMTRALYPHEFLGDVYYAKVVKDLDAQAAGGFDDTAFIDLMREGGTALDDAAEGDFAARAPDKREEILRAVAESHPEFFEAVRSKQVVSLYNQPDVWAEFGYEGPSYPIGGYLYNGFDDISWLPDPSPEASPPLAALEEAAGAQTEEDLGPIEAMPKDLGAKDGASLDKAALGGN